MKITPKQYAVLLYEMTKDVKKSELVGAVQAFVKILMRGRALPMLSRILELYKAYYNTQEGVVDVEVTTARAVPDIKKIVAQTFRSEDIRSKDLSYAFAVNPELLGGARIKVGDYMIDDTLKARLTQLTQTMYGGR